MAGLSAIQEYGQIHNNDIKTENILVYSVKPGGYWKYTIEGKSYYIPNNGKLFVLNDFGVSETYSPIQVLTDKKEKWKSLGLRLGMVIDNVYSPFSIQSTYYGRKKFKPFKVKWGIKDKKGVRSSLCERIKVKHESTGGVSVINRETKEILGVEINFTEEQLVTLRKLNIPADTTDHRFYLHPSVIPPLELRSDTQDVIRMFINGNRATQSGRHGVYDTISDDFKQSLKKYIFNGKTNSYTQAHICNQGLSGRSIRKSFGTYNVNPTTDLAYCFIHDFFRNKYQDLPRDELLLQTYDI